MYKFESIKRYKMYLKRKIIEFDEIFNNLSDISFNNNNNNNKENLKNQHYMRSTESSRRRESFNKETFKPNYSLFNKKTSISPIHHKRSNNDTFLDLKNSLKVDTFLEETPKLPESIINNNILQKWELPNFKEFLNSLDIYNLNEIPMKYKKSFINEIIDDNCLPLKEETNVHLGKNKKLKKKKKK